MKTHPPLDSKPRTNLGGTSGRNPLVGDGLVSPVYKIAKLVIKTSSKVQKPKIYDKAINNLLHRSR